MKQECLQDEFMTLGGRRSSGPGRNRHISLLSPADSSFLCFFCSLSLNVKRVQWTFFCLFCWCAKISYFVPSTALKFFELHFINVCLFISCQHGDDLTLEPLRWRSIIWTMTGCCSWFRLSLQEQLHHWYPSPSQSASHVSCVQQTVCITWTIISSISVISVWGRD